MTAHHKVWIVLAVFGLLELGILCVKGVIAGLFEPVLRALGA